MLVTVLDFFPSPGSAPNIPYLVCPCENYLKATTNCTSFQVLSKPSLAEDEEIRNFFKEVGTFIDRSDPSARLDFLSCPVILSTDWQEVVAELESIMEVGCNPFT